MGALTTTKRGAARALMAGAAMSAAGPVAASESNGTLATRILPVGESAALPWALHPGWFLAGSLLLAAFLWFALAWRQALGEDTNRQRRRGRRELQRLLRAAGARPHATLLRGWLDAAARAWNVPGAAPSASRFRDSLEATDGRRRAWIQLWSEAEHALYSEAGELPDDWLARASHEAAALERPPRTTFWPNRRRHWLPALSAAATVVLGIHIASAAPLAAADDAAPQEQSLESVVQLALERDWSDWAAHHDSAVLYMRRGDWGRALAHGTSAFALNPRSSEVREALWFALQQHGGGADPALSALLDGRAYQRLPALLAPAHWQRLTLIASALLLLGLSALLAAQYAGGRRWRPLGLTVTSMAGVTLTLALAAFQAYGTMTRPSAAVVQTAAEARSIPTDLAPAEETVPLSPGTVVEAQRRFLGWTRVALDHPPSAWVRGDALLPLYRRIPNGTRARTAHVPNPESPQG